MAHQTQSITRTGRIIGLLAVIGLIAALSIELFFLRGGGARRVPVPISQITDGEVPVGWAFFETDAYRIAIPETYPPLDAAAQPLFAELADALEEPAVFGNPDDDAAIFVYAQERAAPASLKEAEFDFMVLFGLIMLPADSPEDLTIEPAALPYSEAFFATGTFTQAETQYRLSGWYHLPSPNGNTTYSVMYIMPAETYTDLRREFETVAASFQFTANQAATE